MAQERGEGPKLTPFERLKALYEEIFDPNDHFRRGIVELEDKTRVFIGPRPWNGDPIKRFDVHFFLEDDEGESRGSGFSFDINKDGGLECISFPLIVAIGGIKCKEYRDGRVIVGEIEGSVEDRTVLAEVLVDWLDKIMKENKFSEPPITASTSEEQK